MMILPRQARDKHRERAQKETRSLKVWTWRCRPNSRSSRVRTITNDYEPFLKLVLAANVSSHHLICQQRWPFYQDRLGTEKRRKRGRFFAQARHLLGTPSTRKLAALTCGRSSTASRHCPLSSTFSGTTCGRKSVLVRGKTTFCCAVFH